MEDVAIVDGDDVDVVVVVVAVVGDFDVESVDGGAGVVVVVVVGGVVVVPDFCFKESTGGGVGLELSMGSL